MPVVGSPCCSVCPPVMFHVCVLLCFLFYFERVWYSLLVVFSVTLACVVIMFHSSQLCPHTSRVYLSPQRHGVCLRTALFPLLGS